MIIAETVDASRFESYKKYKAYYGLAPRLRVSAGRARLGRCGKGNPYLRWAFYMAAMTSVARGGRARERYLRLLGRGKPRRKALVAVAGWLSRIVWVVLTAGVPYSER